jgi:hypothetical protein
MLNILLSAKGRMSGAPGAKLPFEHHDQVLGLAFSI